MADGNPDDDELRSVLRAAIHSFEDLQLLVFLQRNQYRAWSAHELAEAARLPVLDAAAALERFRQNQLVEWIEERAREGASFRYSPSGPEVAKIIERLLEAHERRPATIMRMMTDNALERVRTTALDFFTDALAPRRRGG
jgi:hypothetical protein